MEPRSCSPSVANRAQDSELDRRGEVGVQHVENALPAAFDGFAPPIL